jgi:hypothetical protein
MVNVHFIKKKKKHKLISFINSGHKSGKCLGMFRQCYILSAKRVQVELRHVTHLYSQNHTINCK